MCQSSSRATTSSSVVQEVPAEHITLDAGGGVLQVREVLLACRELLTSRCFVSLLQREWLGDDRHSLRGLVNVDFSSVPLADGADAVVSRSVSF